MVLCLVVVLFAVCLCLIVVSGAAGWLARVLSVVISGGLVVIGLLLLLCLVAGWLWL